MPWTTALPILIWSLIFVPFAVLLWLYIPKSKLTALLILSIYLAIHLIFYWTINWALVSYYLRYLPFIYWIILAIRYYLALSNIPFLPKKQVRSWVLPIILVLVLLITAYFDSMVAHSFNHSGNHVLLMFPLRNGIYVVTNGGNAEQGSGMNNYLTPWFKQEATPDFTKAYAADVMRMNTSGRVSITRRILPKIIQEYEGFNDRVLGPCVGPVIYTEDGHPDVNVGEKSDSELGNFVVIQCADFFITLANLKNGSIIVKPGDFITLNRQIGNVGNSGTPSIPHLLIFATSGGWKDGEGTPVPMLFDGVFSVNNFLFRNKVLIR